MKAQRRKQLRKRIIGLFKQIKRHKKLVMSEKGRLDTTRDYWRKEITRLEKQMLRAKRKLKELEK